MNVEEARAALEAEQGECWHERSGAEGRNHIMTKADTYGAARELKGHVDACLRRELISKDNLIRHGKSCGDDWYCDVAKELAELGR